LGLLLLLSLAKVIHQHVQIDNLKTKFDAEREEIRKDAIKRSRDVLEGKIYEQLAPLFKNWVFDPSDARFLGSPLDFVVFKGMSRGEPKEIVFVEVKTGSSKLTKHQNKLKKLVEEGKVSFELIELGGEHDKYIQEAERPSSLS